jgi:hypothetical protein
VSQVRFAQVGTPATIEPRFRIRTTDGSVIHVDELLIADDGRPIIRMTGDDRRRPIVGGGIVRFDHLRGGVRRLSDLPLLSAKWTPFFPGGAETTVLGFGSVSRPGGEVVHDSIELSPKTTMEFALPAGGTEFVATAALAAPGPMTHCVLTVGVDDQTVKTVEFSPAEPGGEVRVPLPAGKVLRVQLEFGQHFDVNDRLTLYSPFVSVSPR